MPVFVVTVDKLTLKNDLLVDICIKESASDYWTSLSEYISFRYCTWAQTAIGTGIMEEKLPSYQ